jgi:hypothetical protein
VNGRQGQGIVEEDSKGSQGSQRAVELMMMICIYISRIVQMVLVLFSPWKLV